MIHLKTERELTAMRDAGRIAAEALRIAGEYCKVGVTTYEVDQAMHRFILKQGATPSFLHYNGFPASSCISVNDTVIHGIPSKKQVLKEGDIVSVDVGALYNGYHGDNAYTFAVGNVSVQASSLLEITQKSLYEAIERAKSGNRIGDLSYVVSSCVEPYGYGVVREYVGHGVGKQLHESPEVPNYGLAGHGLRLLPGMVVAIEPMINQGDAAVHTLADGWTVKTLDKGLSAHFEHTVAITKDEPMILTKL